MQQEKNESKDSNIWSLIFTIIFIGGVAWGTYFLAGIQDNFSINMFEFIILGLAIFRLIRLATYDSIAQFARDVFTDRTWSDAGDGTFLVMRSKPKKGLRRKLYELFACPWCIGVWISAVVVFFFYATTVAWVPILLLALAGLASFLILLVNLVGWYAEGKKVSVEGRQ